MKSGVFLKIIIVTCILIPFRAAAKSGMYLYRISSGTGIASGKFSVIQ